MREVRKGPTRTRPFYLDFLKRLGVCESALAAAVFAALDDLLVVSTFDAAFAAVRLVCLEFFDMVVPCPVLGGGTASPCTDVLTPTWG